MSSRPAAIAAATIATIVGLTGCSAISDAAQRVHSESFEDRAAAETGWVGVAMPSWIPVDATDLRSTATDDERYAVIALRSDDEPVGCEVAERRALPFDGRYGGIEVNGQLPDEVLACGDYEVVASGDGWIGWFSATDETSVPGEG